MIGGLLLSPFIALIIWVVANNYGHSIQYTETVVYVLVAKASAMYLKNDTSVELTVVKADADTKEETEC